MWREGWRTCRFFPYVVEDEVLELIETFEDAHHCDQREGGRD